jgi:hypothetical protein
VLPQPVYAYLSAARNTVHTHKTHARKMHTRDARPSDARPWGHAYEVYAHETHAREVIAEELEMKSVIKDELFQELEDIKEVGSDDEVDLRVYPG